MFQFDILDLIPKHLKQQALDALVDFVSEQAKKYTGDEIAAKIKQLRSDAAFNRAFEEGLERAAKRFTQEYETRDEDLVAAIIADEDFFKNEEVQTALLAILKKPGAYLADERDKVAESFTSVLPERKNRERVDRAVMYLLKCLAEELWHLPEL
jgi:DNA helicase IV